MTPNTEQSLLLLSQENANRLQRIETAVLDENGDGRLPLAEIRLHDLAVRLRRLEYAYAAAVGAGALLLWELNKLNYLIELLRRKP